MTPSPPVGDGDAVFARRLALTLAALGACWLAVTLHRLLLLAFGAVVIAVIVRTLADALSARLRAPGGVAVPLAIGLIVAALGLAGWLFGHEVIDQAEMLSERLPAAWLHVQAELASSPFGARLLSQLRALGDEANRVFAMAPRIAASGATAVTNLGLILVGGAMLAWKPKTYREGLLALVPKTRRAGTAGALDTAGRALRLWLLGQLVSMGFVGTFTALGLWAVGAPSPLALGLLAGLAQFVPVVGPLASAVPGLLLAGSAGLHELGWTAVVYLGVQQVETNLLTPYVQRRLVQIPMALTLFAVVGFGALFGPLGVVFASPLAVAVFVLVRFALGLESNAATSGDDAPPPPHHHATVKPRA